MYIFVVFQKVWHLVYFWATTHTTHWILHANKIHCTLHSVFSIWRNCNYRTMQCNAMRTMQCNCNYRTMLSTQLRRHLNSSEMGFAGLLIGFTLGVLWLLSLAILSVKFGVVLQQCKPRNGSSFCSEMFAIAPSTGWLLFCGCLKVPVQCQHGN